MKIGSREWILAEELHGKRGIVDAVLSLVVDGQISKGKAVELLENIARLRQEPGLTLSVDAPWDHAYYGGNPEPGLVADLTLKVTDLTLRLAAEQERAQGLVERNRHVTKLVDAATGRTADTREPTGCIGAVEALIKDFEKVKAELEKLEKS
mgnify:CR=1 FL=1